MNDKSSFYKKYYSILTIIIMTENDTKIIVIFRFKTLSVYIRINMNNITYNIYI